MCDLRRGLGHARAVQRGEEGRGQLAHGVGEWRVRGELRGLRERVDERAVACHGSSELVCRTSVRSCDSRRGESRRRDGPHQASGFGIWDEERDDWVARMWGMKRSRAEVRKGRNSR